MKGTYAYAKCECCGRPFRLIVRFPSKFAGLLNPNRLVGICVLCNSQECPEVMAAEDRDVRAQLAGWQA